MIELSSEQRQAIDLCCARHEIIVGVTGGAGTGKTTIMAEVYSDMKKKLRVALAAPTGRAAKRITEATGFPAKTIHKLLGFGPPDEDEDGGAEYYSSNQPRYDKDNPLPLDMVIVDEASMINETLFDQLKWAMPHKSLLRFFGDMNQLPPVQGKAPFERLLKEQESVVLTHNFRSGDELIENAERVLRGRMPQTGERFTCIYTSNTMRMVEEIINADFTTHETQLITPGRKNAIGTNALNTIMQRELNPADAEIVLPRQDEKEPKLRLRANDKIIWTKNDYVLELFNGEICRVEHIDSEDGSVHIVTDDGRPVHVPPLLEGRSRYGSFFYDPRQYIDLGYAITTHKSQGSEFDHVIYVISGRQPFLLNRRNFYTGITRAKRSVTVISDSRAMQYAMRV